MRYRWIMRITITFSLLATIAGCSGQQGDVPDAAAPDASPFAMTHVPLTGCSYSYTADVAVGGSPFRLMVDTGSATLGVAGASCTTCSTAGVAPLYAPGASAVDLDRTVTSTYDDGDMSWSGEVYRDLVSAGTLTAVPLALVDITAQTNFFYADTCGDPQGILGLGPPAILSPGTTSFPTQLATSGAVDELALHFCLGTGDLWFGGYDPAAATAVPTWIPMSTNSYYEVAVSDVAVDGTSVGIPASAYGMAIVDSGGPALGLPTTAYNAAVAKLAASPAFQSRFGNAVFFTSTTTNTCKVLGETREQIDAELPKLTVYVGSPAVAIDLPATASYLQTFPSDGQVMYCPGMFSSPGLTDLGNTLIRAGLVIFDRAHGQLGFAPTAPCTDVLARRVTPTPQMLRRPSRR